MSLSTILKSMNENRSNSEMEVSLGNPDTRRGREGLKRAAVETMKRLRNDYRDELIKSTAFIIVTGGGRDNFTELASSNTFGCFSSDPDSFFTDLVSRINPALLGRETAKNLFNVVENVLVDKMQELNINSYPSLRFNDKYNSAVNGAADLVPLVRSAVTDQVGLEVVGINAIHSIVDKAIASNHGAPVTPVIFNVSDEKFATDLVKGLYKRRLSDGTFIGLTNKVFFVVAGKSSKELQKTEGAITVKTVSEETVGEALSTIKNKLL